VSGLSSASRKRLLEQCATIDWPEPTIFLTLTYGPEFPLPQQAKQNMRSMLERLRRYAPKSSGIWVLEFQKRGAPHFHFVLANLPYIEKKMLQNWWGEIIDFEDPFTRIEAVKSRRVTRYIAKYVSKGQKESEGGACSYEAYDKPTKKDDQPPSGRMWGVFNKPALPLAAKTTHTKCYGRWYHNLKESANEKWNGIDCESQDGFTLFVDDAIQWLDGTDTFE